MINAEKILGRQPKKIILAGDSAGGNLILALTAMTIRRNFVVPDGIVPSYASSIVSREEFWPSLLFSMDDLILT